MKLVILAGGRGSRLHEETHLIPKPMVKIGFYPIIWHIMKYYSTFGVKDFIICLGYKGYVIKEFFLKYNFYINDLRINLADETVEILQKKKENWNVALVETGLNTQTGGRIKRIKEYVKNETFYLTYGDGLSNVDLKKLYSTHKKNKKIATVTSVIPPGRFGLLQSRRNTVVKFKEHTSDNEPSSNGGFFVLNPNIFNYLKGDGTIFEQNTLVDLIEKGQLATYKHSGFWHPMDTVRDRLVLEKLWNKGHAPWKNWN